MLITAGQALINYLGGVGSSLISGVSTTLTTCGTSVGDFCMKLLGQ